MQNTLKRLFFLLPLTALAWSCTNDELTPQYGEQEAGKIVIRAYNALQDSIQINANGKALKIADKDAFVKKIVKDYEFVYYNDEVENIDILDKVTGETLHSYSFTKSASTDTLSFYNNNGYWIDDVLSSRPGKLSGTGYTGYRFIFPTLNRYSKTGYTGSLDGIIKKTNGQLLGTIENITQGEFSAFIEFPFGSPPIIKMELVKHGTTESYIPGQQVFVQMVMQNNKSKLIVLEEKATENGTFSGVEGVINLTDYFDF